MRHFPKLYPQTWEHRFVQNDFVFCSTTISLDWNYETSTCSMWECLYKQCKAHEHIVFWEIYTEQTQNYSHTQQDFYTWSKDLNPKFESSSSLLQVREHIVELPSWVHIHVCTHRFTKGQRQVHPFAVFIIIIINKDFLGSMTLHHTGILANNEQLSYKKIWLLQVAAKRLFFMMCSVQALTPHWWVNYRAPT